jgi:hypothetical protein
MCPGYGPFINPNGPQRGACNSTGTTADGYEAEMGGGDYFDYQFVEVDNVGGPGVAPISSGSFLQSSSCGGGNCSNLTTATVTLGPDFVYQSGIDLIGGGLSGGGQAPLSPKDFQRYLKLSQKALIDLFSKDCISFLTSKGIDVSQLAGTILSQQAYNGSQSTITQGAAGVGITDPNQSVAQGFRRPGVNAAASITTNDVYFHQGGFLSGWFGNGYIQESTIEHEALHNYLKIGDPDLQAQLGVPVNTSNTTNINRALEDHHCTH